jgi:serine/threonine protein kinase
LSALAAGSTLSAGRYRLEAVLGRGGMAIVWRATDQQLERPVAIKIISDVLATDPRFVARFEREARLAAALSHENLVKVFDFSIESERPFLVMEYIPGGTLAEARDDGLDAEALARELLDAVAHIHAAGILHRDIKPANVLLDADRSPRLTDFGIARSEETTGLTQTGQILGTLRYIAPEVARGEPATVQSDIYSLGVLLGEVAGDDAPPELTDLIVRMTAGTPANRPASAAGALADLDPTRILPETKTIPIPAMQHAASGQTPQPRVEVSDTFPRWQVFAAAAVLVAVLVLVIVAASGGGSKLDVKAPSTVLRPAPAGAPVSRQLDQLEQLVRAAPR